MLPGVLADSPVLALLRELIDLRRQYEGDQIAVAEGDPASGFKGKLIVGKRAVRCLFVSEASYLTRGPDQRVLRSAGLVTIFLVYASDAQHFDVRKALASGGALEDPAIGVAAAAFAGYLCDLDLAARRYD